MPDNNGIKLNINLPDELYIKLKSFIETTIKDCLQSHVAAIKAEPQKFTRQETAKKLRVCPETLDRYVQKGYIPKPQRIGRKILFTEDQINNFRHTGH